MGAEHEWAGDAGVRAILDGLGMAAPRPGRSRSARCPVANAAGSRWPRCWSATADLLILDEPTNHLDVAGVDWLARHLLGRARRAGRGHPRPVVPRRGLHRHLGGRRRDRSAPTRAATRPGPWPAPSAQRVAADHRGPPAEPAPQGDRLAAPRPAGPYLQAAVPHRRGQRADRRRAAGPRHRSPAAHGHRPARQAGVRPGGRHPARRPEADPRRPHLAGRPGRPDRHPRRQRRRQDHPAAAARRHHPTRRRPAGHRLHRAARVPLPGAAPSCPAHLRVLEAVEEVARRVKLGDRELSAGPARRGVRLHRQAASGPRSATCPAASGAGCRCCGCSPASPTCCCSTSPPTTWTPTPWPRWRTCSTPGPARWSSPATTATWSSGSPTRRTGCSATAGWCTCPAASTNTSPGRPSRPAAASVGPAATPPRPRPRPGMSAAEVRAGPQGAGPPGAAARPSSRSASAALNEKLADHATDYEKIVELDAQLKAVQARTRARSRRPGSSWPSRCPDS